MNRYKMTWQKAEQIGLDAIVLAVGWAFTMSLAFKFLSAEAVPPAQVGGGGAPDRPGGPPATPGG
jgi:hypothetical protein